MTVPHEFGGSWTEDKLDRLRKYLPAYLNIFKANERARHFQTVYVDAFAGTGHRAEGKSGVAASALFPELAEAETQRFLKGSAQIALDLDPAFNKYVFVEANAAHCGELVRLRGEYPDMASRIEVHQADANLFMRDWCRRTDWRRMRAVVFLDPYGMQVDWATVEAIARTQGIDLWLLFPLGAAVNRVLTSGGPPPEQWAKALTRTLGTDAWREAFYPKRQTLTLFGTDEVQAKDADFKAIGQFFVERLKTVFPGVATNPLPLRNTMGVPIYLLCFASANPKGATTAVRIASHVLRPTTRRSA